MTPPDIITRYADAFAGLTPDTMDRLMATVSADVRFVDPFNDVTGRDGFRAIFEHMFETCEEPRFHILDIATSTDQGEQRAYLRWRMSGRVRRLAAHRSGAGRDERGPCRQGRACLPASRPLGQRQPAAGAPAGHRRDHKARAEAVPDQTGRKVSSTSPSLKPALETVARFTITPPA